MAQPFQLTTDQQLKEAVRDATSYADTADELPDSQLDGNLADAKRDMFIETGSDKWYDDVAYGQALKAWTQVIAKAAVENINIDSYSIADEEISLSNATPEQSQQIMLWAKQSSKALDKSDVDFPNYSQLTLKNTSGYVGNN